MTAQPSTPSGSVVDNQPSQPTLGPLSSDVSSNVQALTTEGGATQGHTATTGAMPIAEILVGQGDIDAHQGPDPADFELR